MKKKALILSTGFAMFSMFFGSGNLVFPLLVGQQSSGHYLLSALGIFITGVIVPFLGVLAMMLCKGNLQEFFRSIGKVGTFVFSLIVLTLIGPLGVIPRCLIVAHGALEQVFPSVSLLGASFFACIAVYFLTINRNKIVPVLGTILTPVLLVAIFAIAVVAIFQQSLPVPLSGNGVSWHAFKTGFFQGYNTMDLLASFFFSTFIIEHLQSTKKEGVCEKTSLTTFFRSALVGGGLLALVYFFLVVLGSIYAPQLALIQPQEIFGYVAFQTLGSLAAPCMCIAVVLACLTTAVVLAALFADFLRKDILQNKLGNKVSLAITMALAFFMSTLKFSGIMMILGPVVELIYPALIMLTIVNIIHKLWGLKNSHWPTTLTLVAKIYSVL
ncbi:MAG: branched-chain amino acid transport system II carrier protein [Rhabdochlamydiaceae bacterium]|nr:branched-chain amino acid transport system II carrier protein [Rhabdochlamydiaceae bacterium]